MAFGDSNEDMVFTPRLEVRTRSRNVQRMAEARALGMGHTRKKTLWYQMGLRLALRRASLADRVLRRNGRTALTKRSSIQARMMGRAALGGPAFAAASGIEALIHTITTGVMTVRTLGGGPTFEQQAASFSRFMFGDAPAKIRAAVQTRQHIFRNPMLMASLAEGHSDEVYELTRPFYTDALLMEKAFDDIMEDVPGGQTTLESIVKNVERKIKNCRHLSEAKRFKIACTLSGKQHRMLVTICE